MTQMPSARERLLRRGHLEERSNGCGPLYRWTDCQDGQTWCVPGTLSHGDRAGQRGASHLDDRERSGRAGIPSVLTQFRLRFQP